MAIGPTQLDDNFKKEVEAFEMLIDRALMKKTLSPGGKVMIDTPKGLTGLHLVSLIEKYTKAGWKTIRQEYGDQRDPTNCLVFES